MEIADKGEKSDMWRGESADREVKEEGACRISYMHFEYMMKVAKFTLFCIYVDILRTFLSRI